MVTLPKYDDLMPPIIQVLKELGGSGTISEIDSGVIEKLNLSDEQLEVLHNPEKTTRSEIEYRLAWARTYLKKFGLIENSSRGVWALTVNGREVENIDTDKIKRFVRGNYSNQNDSEDNPEVNQEQQWREDLMTTLLTMDPSAFERLAQRILRESGFIQVEVTGRSNDGGIDGKGIMRLSGLLSFHVIFQCKRYKSNVSASQVRDFRGAMVGRADKGLLITTSDFTKEAKREATRDGAPPIDLIDGDLLIDKLKELELGITTKTIITEEIEINHEWFEGI